MKSACGDSVLLYRHLAKNMDTRYEIFVGGQYRVDRIRESGALGKSEIHLAGLPKLASGDVRTAIRLSAGRD